MTTPEHVPAADVTLLPPGTRPPGVAPIDPDTWNQALRNAADRLQRVAADMLFTHNPDEWQRPGAFVRVPLDEWQP